MTNGEQQLGAIDREGMISAVNSIVRQWTVVLPDAVNSREFITQEGLEQVVDGDDNCIPFSGCGHPTYGLTQED